mmetsp:Transcript_10000/g.19776  ORF Transcript_10000/g.19776 Transcript_10000/m.19776 type:complete len:98 (-) Transcript_10000:16-309(-)
MSPSSQTHAENTAKSSKIFFPAYFIHKNEICAASIIEPYLVSRLTVSSFEEVTDFGPETQWETVPFSFCKASVASEAMENDFTRLRLVVPERTETHL